jgi:hypothetical protein
VRDKLSAQRAGRLVHETHGLAPRAVKLRGWPIGGTTTQHNGSAMEPRRAGLGECAADSVMPTSEKLVGALRLHRG